jgi:hypothetical protein
MGRSNLQQVGEHVSEVTSHLELALAGKSNLVDRQLHVLIPARTQSPQPLALQRHALPPFRA